LVDETFNRVTRKLEDGETIRDMPTYCHDVARDLGLKKGVSVYALVKATKVMIIRG
jgi:molybdopterin-binding protein